MAVVEVRACRPSAAVVLGYRLPPTTCALCSSPDRACGCVIPTFIILLQEQLTLTLGIEYRCVIYCRKYTPHVASKLIQDRVRRLFALLEHSLIFDFFPRSRLAADYLGSMSNGIIHQKILQGRRALCWHPASPACTATLSSSWCAEYLFIYLNAAVTSQAHVASLGFSTWCMWTNCAIADGAVELPNPLSSRRGLESPSTLFRDPPRSRRADIHIFPSPPPLSATTDVE